jgi:hypothetical protein
VRGGVDENEKQSCFCMLDSIQPLDDTVSRCAVAQRGESPAQKELCTHKGHRVNSISHAVAGSARKN